MNLHLRARSWQSYLALFSCVALLALVLGSVGGLSRAAAQTESQVNRGSGLGRLELEIDPAMLASQQSIDVELGPDQWQTVLSENFEGTWPTGNWQVFDGDDATNGEYYWSNRCTGKNSARSAWAVGGGANGSSLSCGDHYPNNADSVAIYGPLDFTDVVAAEISYDMWVNTECVGTDCVDKRDSFWVLWFSDPDDMEGYWSAGPWIDDPGADPQGWVSRTHDVSHLAGQPKVWVGMWFDSDATTNAPGGGFIDNLLVRVEKCEETATIRSVTTDRSCYIPGSQIGVFVDVGSTLPSQSVSIEVQLAQFDIVWAQTQRIISAPGQTTLTLQVPQDRTVGDYTVRVIVIDVATECFQDMEEVSVRIDPVCGTVTPPVPWTATPTPTRTRTPTPTATPTQCPPARSWTPIACTDVNYIRNPGYERYNRSWGSYSLLGRDVMTTQALDGFLSAHFHGTAGQANEEVLFQFIDIPPDIDNASFTVSDFLRSNTAVNPPAIRGNDYFRASIYDLTLRNELVRMWEFDPVLPEECPVDSPNYNLSPGELDAIRGRTVALVFHFHKATLGWQTSVLIDRVQFYVCSSGPPCRVERDKRAHPNVVPPGGEVTVVLSLTGQDGACLPHRTSADVMLVIDRSGSMSEQNGRPIRDAKAASIAFVNRLDMATDQVGLVSFADTALRNVGLMSRAGDVKSAINGLNASGNTNIKDAIAMAQAELASSRRKAGNAPVMVLLSDGLPNRPSGNADPRPEATAAKAAGTRIFTIGLGDGVDPNLMRELASSPSDYFFAPNSSQLDAIYQQIAGAISGSPATNITIVDRLSQYVTLIPNSFTGSPLPEVSPDGRTLTWRIPRLGLETRTWSYRVRMTQTPGTWPTNDSATATYTDSNGNPASLTFPIPEVTVLQPEEHHPEVMCRDHPGDNGSVPSNVNGEPWWDSPDIWVRTSQDGVPAHQNPVAGQTNYVYVRVRNIGDATVNNITVRAYDSLGAVNLRWPDDWVPEIGSATIPSLAPGRVTVVSIPWTPVVDGHFCFLTRIEASEDPIKFDGWVPFDNNICQRNVQVVESGNSTTSVGGGNRERGSGYGKLTLKSKNLPRSASGKITFTDPQLYERWRVAGGSVAGGRANDQDHSIEFGTGVFGVHEQGVADEGVVDLAIDDIPFEGEEVGAFAIEIAGPPDSEAPTLELVEWMEGRPVGGNVIRAPVLRPYAVYLPSLASSYSYESILSERWLSRPSAWPR